MKWPFKFFLVCGLLIQVFWDCWNSCYNAENKLCMWVAICWLHLHRNFTQQYKNIYSNSPNQWLVKVMRKYYHECFRLSMKVSLIISYLTYVLLLPELLQFSNSPAFQWIMLNFISSSYMIWNIISNNRIHLFTSSQSLTAANAIWTCFLRQLSKEFHTLYTNSYTRQQFNFLNWWSSERVMASWLKILAFRQKLG